MKSIYVSDMYPRMVVRVAAGLRLHVLIAAIAAWNPAYAVAVDAAEAIVTQETDIKGLTAQVVRCRRKEGVLTIALEFRNNSTEPTFLSIINETQGSDNFYVISNNKKYLFLRDSEGTPIAKQNGIMALLPSQTWTWWASYPAPSDDIKEINFITPLTLPFEDLPIED
jgi:hypothetical protein